MNSKPNSRKKDDNDSLNIKNIFIGTVLGMVMFFGLTSLYTLLYLENSGNASMFKPIGIIFGFLGASLGGFITARPIRKKGAIFGGITGATVALTLSVVLFFVNNSSAGMGIFIFMGVTLLGGIIGGITAVNLKIKKKY